MSLKRGVLPHGPHRRYSVHPWEAEISEERRGGGCIRAVAGRNRRGRLRPASSALLRTAEHPRGGIPNQTVKRLTYGYLRDGYRDVGCSGSACSASSGADADGQRGRVAARVRVPGRAIARQTGIRDYVAGEKVIEPRAGASGFLAAYPSVADYYVFRSEAELGEGYADIALEPLIARYPRATTRRWSLVYLQAPDFLRW